MIKRILKSLLKFFIGLGMGLLLFDLIINNPNNLDFFVKDKYSTHVYTSIVFIVSSIFAIDFKNIKIDLQLIIKKCNDFDKKVILILTKRPVK